MIRTGFTASSGAFRSIVWILVVCSFFSALLLSGAANRPFWIDETYGINQAFLPWDQLIVSGPPDQCSRAPLFYLILKGWFALAPGAESSLVMARLPTILSAGLILGLVMWPLKGLGKALAIFVAANLFKDEVFIAQMTEARPYPIWLLLTVSTLFPLGKFLYRTETRKDYLILGSLALLLTSVSTGSVFFLAGIGLLAVLCRRDIFFRLSLAFAPAALVGIYYALLSTCGDYSSNPYSFSSLVQAGDLTTAKQIIKMLFSPKDLVELPINVLYLGLSIKLIRTKDLVLERRAIAAALFLFIVTALLTCAALIYNDYFLIPRMFIFLLALKVVLIGVALRILRAETPANRNWLLNGGALACSALFIFQALRVYPLDRIF